MDGRSRRTRPNVGRISSLSGEGQIWLVSAELVQTWSTLRQLWSMPPRMWSKLGEREPASDDIAKHRPTLGPKWPELVRVWPKPTHIGQLRANLGPDAAMACLRPTWARTFRQSGPSFG